MRLPNSRYWCCYYCCCCCCCCCCCVRCAVCCAWMLEVKAIAGRVIAPAHVRRPTTKLIWLSLIFSLLRDNGIVVPLLLVCRLQQYETTAVCCMLSYGSMSVHVSTSQHLQSINTRSWHDLCARTAVPGIRVAVDVVHDLLVWCSPHVRKRSVMSPQWMSLHSSSITIYR